MASDRGGHPGHAHQAGEPGDEAPGIETATGEHQVVERDLFWNGAAPVKR